MKGVKPVVLLVAMMMAKPSFAQDNESDSPITIELTREGDSATVFIRATGEDVFLPACRGVVWEQFILPEDGGEGRYVSLTEAPCGASKPPIKVSKDGVRFKAPPLMGSKTTVLRAVTVVGLGCAADLPMAVGGCSQMHSQTSPNITINLGVSE